MAFYKFRGFCLDTNERMLSYGDSPVSLTPKAYQTLLVLLENRNRIVEKDFLLNQVWADTFVEETTLSQNILTLRKALRKYDRDGEFIVTFPRRGFRFVADVVELQENEETIFIEKYTKLRIVEEHELEIPLPPTRDGEKVENSNLRLTSRFLQPRSLAIVSTIVAIFVAFNFLFFYFGEKLSLAESNKSLVQTLVSNTEIKHASVSPNGKLLALIEAKDGIQTLSVRQNENGNTIDIVSKLNGTVLGLTISPDNESIYYSIAEPDSSERVSIGTLYKVSVFGGASQKISSHVDSSPSISFDNSKIAFIRRDEDKKETNLIVAKTNGTLERIVASQPFEQGYTSAGASWSPDGKLLSAAVEDLRENGKAFYISVINTETTEQQFLKNENWKWLGQTAWSNNGNSIIFTGFRDSSPTLSDELWQVSYPDGKTKFLNAGVKGIGGISVDRETNSIVSIKPDKLTCFLSASLDNFRKSNHISTRIGDSCLLSVGADWTNDGQIVYSTNEGKNADIWTIDENGGKKKQLTAESSAEISPQISDDGRYLVFLSNRSGKLNVWRANADGTNQIQLTKDQDVVESIISPNNEDVFFVVRSPNTDENSLWKMKINGENQIQISEQTVRSPRVSPDGKLIACYLPKSYDKMSIALISTDNGDLIKTVKPPPNDSIPFLDWSKDGENLFVISQKGKPFFLWKLAVNGSKLENMREWENDAIFRFVVSKNGERVFYEVGTEITSVVRFLGTARNR